MIRASNPSSADPAHPAWLCTGDAVIAFHRLVQQSFFPCQDTKRIRCIIPSIIRTLTSFYSMQIPVIVDYELTNTSMKNSINMNINSHGRLGNKDRDNLYNQNARACSNTHLLGLAHGIYNPPSMPTLLLLLCAVGLALEKCYRL